MIRDSSRPSRTLLQLIVLSAIVTYFTWQWAPRRASDAESSGGDERIDRALEPSASAAAPRDGIAAVVLMDVSGSMDDPIGGTKSAPTKIHIAREAALVLIRQFETYARAHPDEVVEVGLIEFSGRRGSSARSVIPLSRPNSVDAESALAQMQAGGGTPIGDAIVAGKRALDDAGLSRRHLLVVTDGENTDGFEPDDVLRALSRRPEAERPSVYFVAFDLETSRLSKVRDAGGLVLPAANAEELTTTLDSLLTGKILVEGP